MSRKLLKVKNLKTYYKTRMHEKIYAVDGVSLEIEEGKVLGVAGESGCGKSTLAHSLMGLYIPPLYYSQGSIEIDGKEIIIDDKEYLRKNVLGKEISYIPQAAMNALNPTLKIRKFIEDIMAEHRPNLSKKDVYDLAAERFSNLNLSPRVLDAFPNELSGGMKQRTIIAISTILNPKILVADEPTSALDVSSQKIVMKLIKQLLEKQYIKSLIFVTHELPLLYHIADDIVIMYAGEIVERGSSDEVIFDPIHPYSKALMASMLVPEKGAKDQKLVAIPGSPPNLKSVIKGCRFADRCKYADEECRKSKVHEKILDNRIYRCKK
ncbi:ABC transporter ATP-binding protein [Paramaledivibacter caminithermalis]|jgi:peptide/nickel transport system ATP-binding protein|uniref:Peptide/nickel transport system ATP-binding protein n=1 Tax=Paramaledivibacter caminithermalis (strain DSM 15212 / CIP 107654 / DViRD3) TaxID=1121301 RepID=A0A1M6RGY7_PARC5|nr:ABC transporter ATP-binding protein [Paramaledivibacter caminithermalis]SHK31703.1 peptide/nickel transport system ATP-binding protein [Paramaledivibacter caminithermalis DSM 15212]